GEDASGSEKELMTTRTTLVHTFRRRALPWVVAAVSVLPAARWGRAEEPDAKTFSSAADACHALFHAGRDDDTQALAAILGQDLVSSGAESEAKLERHEFDVKYCEMHRLVREPDGSTVLYVGAENWPFPVPLVVEGGRWRFDGAAGAQEI